MGFCLVVEDDPRQRAMIAAMLRNAGHTTVECEGAGGALRRLEESAPDVILLDLGLPDMDGLQLIERILSLVPSARIVVLTGDASVAMAVRALRAGARHYLVKPWDREELLVVIEREIRSLCLDEIHALDKGGGIYWGKTPGIREVLQKIGRIAASPWTPVLITGETGVGKEVVARELHQRGGGGRPFVPVNCAAVPDELLESELFGHEPGAFTGAGRRRRGFVELAEGGTLFLDEIGDMSLPLQAKFLRFLQDRRFFRLGGEREIEVTCRVVAATHRDLPAMVRAGTFRQDLYYRLAVVTLELPPLRERREDIVPMASYLIKEIAREIGVRPRQLSPAAEKVLEAYPWPGNVREMRNRLERALILGSGPMIRPADLDLAPLSAGPNGGYSSESSPERMRILRALEDENWVVARAARRLGVPRHWLRYRMRKFGLVRPDRT